MPSVLITVELEVEVFYQDSEQYGLDIGGAICETTAPNEVQAWACEQAKKRLAEKGV